MSEQHDRVHLRWRTVALVAVVLALAASVLAAVVSSVREVDGLSVIALALAVIAFVVQIIVYIAQADSAAKQQMQASQVYGKTISALAAIEEKAEGTRTTVNTLSDRLLDAAIGKALPEAESEGAPVGSEEFAETVSRIVRDIVNSPPSPSAPPERTKLPVRLADASMWQLPSKERVSAALDALVSLSGGQLSTVNRLALDQARSGGSTGPRIGPGVRSLNPFTVKELHERGLIVRRRVMWSSEPIFQLTDLGKDAGRLLLADDANTATDPRAQEVRAKLDAHREQLEQLTKASRDYEGIPVVE